MVKTLQPTSLLLISVIIIILCSVHTSAVTANARITPVQGNAPLNVLFTDLSEGSVIEWHWDFGDGFTGDGPKTMHTYLSPGTYSVKLLVFDGQGLSDTAIFNNAIIVHSNPFMPSMPVALPSFSADFTGGPLNGPSPLAVHFSDLSKGEPLKWLWDFGDETKSSEINPVHVYNNPGLYSVILKISRDTSSGMKERKNYIQVTEGRSSGQTTVVSTEPSIPINQQPVQEIPVTGTGTDQTPHITYSTSEYGDICDSGLLLKSESTTINSGKNFTITIRGSPLEKIYLWITGDTNEYPRSQEFPYITDNEMVFDDAAGPYLIGSYIPETKAGLTIRDMIIENQSKYSVRYYGMVALDKKGEHNFIYETENASPGNYSVNAVTGVDSEKNGCVESFHITIVPDSNN